MTDQDTRYRILKAAAELFTENGFQKTTVRSICEAAKANVAAVNYHFGGKKGLYGALIEQAIEEKSEVEIPANATPEQALRAWVSRLVHSCVGPEADLLSRIMTNEMAKPSGFLPMIIEKAVLPRLQLLSDIVGQALGAEADRDRVQLLSLSVVGQILLYDHCKPAVAFVRPSMDYSEQQLELLVDHITQASLGMISSFRETTAQ